MYRQKEPEKLMSIADTPSCDMPDLQKSDYQPKACAPDR